MGTAQSSKAVSAIDQVSQSPVVIYSKTDCSFCDKAKNLLSHEQVPYVAYELNQMVNGRQIFGEIFAQTHLRTVPQIFICGEFVGGYSELLQLYNSGRLKSAVDQCSSVKMDIDRTGMLVITGNSHPDLAKQVADKLGEKLGDCNVYNKVNRETIVDIKDSLRGKDVFIIQTGTKDVNNNIMELLIMIYACKTAACRTITAVMPYIPYSKQCKMRKRSSIVAKLMAQLICKAGADKVITMDLHRKEIQGFFDIPVDNVRASPFLLQYIQEKIPDYKNAVIVAKNPGVMNKATSYAERLRLSIAVIHGEHKEGDSDQVDGRYSPPPNVKRTETCQTGRLMFMPSIMAKEKPPLTVVGDVGGRIAIMVDDMIDEVDSFVACAEVLKERGAYKVYVVVTHGLLSADAPQILEKSPIDEVVVTNTVPHDIQKMQCHKIKTVDISSMLTEAIRRTYHNESMSFLFRNITLDD